MVHYESLSPELWVTWRKLSKSVNVEMSWFSLQGRWPEMWQQPVWAARLTIC